MLEMALLDNEQIVSHRRSTTFSNVAKTSLRNPRFRISLDNYDILNPAQKNVLWKLVLKKATMYRGETKGELRVKLYPNLPR